MCNVLQVWVSYATFELSRSDEDSVPMARQVYRDAYKTMKEQGDKEERLMLLEEWKEFEV